MGESRWGWMSLTAVAGWVVLAGIALAGASAAEPKGESAAPPALRTAAITRGDLAVTVSAAGTLVPEELVDVNADVAGRIVMIGSTDGTKTEISGGDVREGLEVIVGSPSPPSPFAPKLFNKAGAASPPRGDIQIACPTGTGFPSPARRPERA